jgi:iron uptake system EfeUOB component EfeO/EfeM
MNRNQENLKKALNSYKVREKDELPEFVKKLKTITTAFGILYFIL